MKSYATVTQGDKTELIEVRAEEFAAAVDTSAKRVDGHACAIPVHQGRSVGGQQ